MSRKTQKTRRKQTVEANAKTTSKAATPDTSTSNALAPDAFTRGPAKAPRKSERLVTMLEAERGVTIAELSAELAWQPHSTRAALSGLRKSGRDIERLTATGEPSRYRISVAEPTSTEGAS